MSDLTVSEVEIIPVKPKNGLVTFASFVLNGQLYIGDVAVYTRPNSEGFRLVYPAKSLANGKRINCVHPINKETGRAILEAIVNKLKQLMPDYC